MNFMQALEKRRSIYHLGKNIDISSEEITTIIKECLKHSPSAFNFPTVNIIIAFSEKHEQIWQITTDCLQEKLTTKPEAFAIAEQKIANFKSGLGTILFFEDTALIDELKETYAMYADNFATWSSQANGMLQANIWTALADNNIGANLQHYNPLIDEKISKLFNIPSTWVLTAQMPFGSIEEQPKEKYIDDVDSRIKIY